MALSAKRPMTYYTIKVQGHLPAHYSDWFDGLAITYDHAGNTILIGEVRDQAALHSVLGKVRDMNLTMISVSTVRPTTSKTHVWRTIMSPKSITSYFMLTLLLSLPAYILINMAGNNIIFTSENALAFIPLVTLAPIGAAVILTFRSGGWASTKRLLSRSFDYKRIGDKRWYLPTFLLLPLLFGLALFAARWLNLPLIDPIFPITVLPLVFLSLFVGALGEEVGWMGYLFEPLQARMNAFGATLVLGVFWAVWHIPIYLTMIGDPIQILAQCVSLLGLRLLIVWLFNNTNQSVFVTILFHTMYNVTVGGLPVNLIVSTAVLLAAAIFIATFGRIAPYTDSQGYAPR